MADEDSTTPTPASPRPVVDLSFERMFCGIHGEPFRERWPRGALIFQLAALKHVLGTQEFWDENDQRFGGKSSPDAEIPHAQIEQLLDIQPLCCRLDKAKLLELYEYQHASGGIGIKSFCFAPACGAFALGAPFLQAVPGGGRQRIGHVCFRCIAFRVTPRGD